MGLLVDGVWRDDSFDKARMEGGRFNRPTTKFRNWITPDGSPGPTGRAASPPKSGRYHLYVSLACPWAHRTIILRHLKRLENVISMSVTSWYMGENGWTFDRMTGSSGDTVNWRRRSRRSICWPIANTPAASRCPCCGTSSARPSSATSRPRSSACSIRRSTPSRASTPTSIRRTCAAKSTRSTISSIANVNNGVYRAGFATAQEAYEEAFRGVFATLDELERRLARQRYLAGPRMTEADWRLFTTLIRFDAVYYSHFKCNMRRIRDYPNLSNYLRDLYQVPGIDETVSLDHIKRHYYHSQRKINPTGIWPLGPELDFTAPHDRDRFVS